MARRLLVIGWDGAAPEIVSSLLAKGKLPNLAKLIDNGYYAPLQSTMRPESSTAWTTFATGVDPGVHSIFGFMRHIKGSYETALNNSNYVRVPYFWETLSKAGKRVVILNMPMVYPPRPVNGYMVCGLMTPEKSRVFTYPPELGSRLLEKGYIVDAKAVQTGENRYKYLERMKALVKHRTKTAVDLLGEQEWDLGIIVYTELDRIQHFFWADMSPEHPLHPKQALNDAIPEHYVELDQSLGELLAFVGMETDVIILSDHGFGPCSQQFCVNAWLMEHHLLKSHKTSAYGSSAALGLLNTLKQNGLVRKTKRLILGEKPIILPVKRKAAQYMIDWAETKAWFADSGGIRINLKGREPQGIVSTGYEYENLVDEIIIALKQTTDASGNNVVKEAYRSRDLYNGPEIEAAPDIVIEPYRGNNEISSNYWVSGWTANTRTIFANSLPYTGEHTNYGVLAENIIPDAPVRNISDVTAQIMHLMNAAINNTSEVSEITKGYDYSDEDQEMLRKRLSDLGYLG